MTRNPNFSHSGSLRITPFENLTRYGSRGDLRVNTFLRSSVCPFDSLFSNIDTQQVKMKFRSLIALATAITAVAANGKPKGPQGDTVPGNNGFRYCKDEDYPIQFNIVDIEPLNVSA